MLDPVDTWCSDIYIIGTIDDLFFRDYFTKGTKTIIFKKTSKESLDYDLFKVGIRIFSYK